MRLRWGQAGHLSSHLGSAAGIRTHEWLVCGGPQGGCRLVCHQATWLGDGSSCTMRAHLIWQDPFSMAGAALLPFIVAGGPLSIQRKASHLHGKCIHWSGPEVMTTQALPHVQNPSRSAPCVHHVPPIPRPMRAWVDPPGLGDPPSPLCKPWLHALPGTVPSVGPRSRDPRRM